MAQPPVTLLLSVGRLMRSRLEKVLPLPLAQCEVLRCVEEMDEPTMRQLAAHFRIAAPSATTLVVPLVEQGYVSRKADAKDRRHVRLTLTSKGKKMAVVLDKKRAAVISRMLSVLNTQDVADLKRILSSIINHSS